MDVVLLFFDVVFCGVFAMNMINSLRASQKIQSSLYSVLTAAAVLKTIFAVVEMG